VGGDELFDFVEVVAGDVVGVEEALHHGRERAVERVLEGVKQFAALRLGFGHGGAIEGDVALFLGGEQALGDHAIHQRADGGVGPCGLLEKLLLHGGRGAGLGVPDSFDDGPLGFGEFNGRLRHGGEIWVTGGRMLYSCRDGKGNLYICKDEGS